MSDNALKGAADYGLRYPAATLLNEEGAFDGHVVEAPLAHDPEKKSVCLKQHWSDRLDSLRDGAPTVPLRGSAV